MTDEELAAEICPDNLSEGLMIAQGLSAEKRAGLERLLEVGSELSLWEAGIGPMPSGVIVNRGRSKWYNKDRKR